MEIGFSVWYIITVVLVFNYIWSTIPVRTWWHMNIASYQSSTLCSATVHWVQKPHLKHLEYVCTESWTVKAYFRCDYGVCTYFVVFNQCRAGCWGTDWEVIISFLDSTDNRLTCYIKLQKDTESKSNKSNTHNTHPNLYTNTRATVSLLRRSPDVQILLWRQ